MGSLIRIRRRGGGGGGGSEGSNFVRSLASDPANLKDGDMFIRRGTLYQHDKTDPTGRSVTKYSLTNPEITHNGVTLRNPNYSDHYRGVVPRNGNPEQLFSNLVEDDFWMDYGVYTFGVQDSNGDPQPYDPFGMGEPWDNVVGFPAYNDLANSTGNRGVRISHATTLDRQAGENGHDYNLVVSVDGALGARVSVNIDALGDLEILLKNNNGHSQNAPTLNEIIAAVEAAEGPNGEKFAARKITATDDGNAVRANNFAVANAAFSGGQGAGATNLISVAGAADHSPHIDTQPHLAEGQVWVAVSDHSLYGIYDFTPGTAGINQNRVLIPHHRQYFNNPVAEFWGRGQSERWPSNYPNTDNGANIRRLRFASLTNDLPHAYWDGGDTLIGNPFIDVSADPDLSIINSVDNRIIDGGDNLDDWTVFSLPAGRYNISAWLGQNQNFNQSAVFSLRKVTSGDDDIQIHEGLGYFTGNTAGEDTRQSVEIHITDLVVSDTDKFYLSITGLPENINTRHFIRIERVA